MSWNEGMLVGNTYFFTGFPGFITKELIKQLIRDHADIDHLYLLTIPSLVKKAEEELEHLVCTEEINQSMLTIVEGDITKKDLGLPQPVSDKLQTEITHVFHLAAIYDLAVPKDIAYQVNVVGTKKVNEWVQSVQNMKRYVYFSTAYVSGTREGMIYETELDKNQSFKNHYEQTKYEAEVLVQTMSQQVPTTIIRPGIVTGHSQSGETSKFDGPYFILNLFDRIRYSPLIPFIGVEHVEGSFVPVDYVVQATVYLSHSEKGIGHTYHLTHPNPYSLLDVYELFLQSLLGKKPRGILPLTVAKAFLSISFIRKWLRIEKEALDYLQYDVHYDCSQTERDLAGSGITCPDIRVFAESMIHYYQEYKHDHHKYIDIN